MKRNVGLGIIVSLLFLTIGVCGCTVNNSDLPSNTESVVSLNQRQKDILAEQISTIEASISNVEKILDPNILELFLDAGIVLIMIPIVLIYIALQKQFIEGVERSGIVG